ncbi:unnamed protein product [Adineta ricciae]|uniref:Uncharacterized protein n=1 Tax=Adineta ricciae TaxID=249248 RepID=A0A815M2G3_ADIRI|nr:unnamed protein product [Adineta ricciae]CAF1418195.1 unnamed protein product [Adineta ricciae]
MVFLNIIRECLNLNSGPLAGVNINDIVPSRLAVAREVTRQPNEIRECSGVELKDVANKGYLSISSDLCSDKFKQNSSLC